MLPYFVLGVGEAFYEKETHNKRNIGIVFICNGGNGFSLFDHITNGNIFVKIYVRKTLSTSAFFLVKK